MTQSKETPKSKGKSRASKSAKAATKPKLTTKKGLSAKVLTKSTTKAKPRAGVAQATGANTRRIDQRLLALGGWRADTLAVVRRLIHEAVPDVVEEIKWVKPTNPRGVPVWSHAGIVCTGESYKQVVKLTFARGASLADPSGLFNSSLEGNARRAIDIREGEVLEARAFKALVQAAVAENLKASNAKPRSKPKLSVTTKSTTKPSAKRKGEAKSNATAHTKPGTKRTEPVKLLSGGNPQIAKGDGDAPVQAYLAAIPETKRELGKRLDALIEHSMPSVRKVCR